MEYSKELAHEDLNYNFAALAKVLSGDLVIALSQTTAAPKAAECAAAALSYDIDISLTDSAGNLQEWYSGKIKTAVSKVSAVSGATFTISPAAGEISMVGGTASVTVTMSKVEWVAGNTATLTVTTPTAAGAGICGWKASSTFVVTVAA